MGANYHDCTNVLIVKQKSINNISVYINCIQADLGHPNSLVPIKMCSDYGTCGLLNHCKYKIIEEVTRKCVRIVRHGD